MRLGWPGGWSHGDRVLLQSKTAERERNIRVISKHRRSHSVSLQLEFESGGVKVGLACAFFGVLSRFYFRREQTPRFHRFLVSGPVRDARTEHPCVQTSARHDTVSMEKQCADLLPGRGVAPPARSSSG